MREWAALAVILVLSPGTRAAGQSSSRADAAGTRLAILAAEDRRAATPRDLATIRLGAHSGDPQTARIAVRALGRLERPELIADIVPCLRHALPELRMEAANAIAQAARGWTHEPPSSVPRTNLDVAAAALTARLAVDADANARAAISESIGRLPFVSPQQVEKAEQALLDVVVRRQTPADRLGVASGLRGLVRLRRRLNMPNQDVFPVLRMLAVGSSDQGGTERFPRASSPADPARDARVRRLALDGLIEGDGVDEGVLRHAAEDPDAQVRRLAMKAAAGGPRIEADLAADVLRQGLADPSPAVRVEALFASRKHREGIDACRVAMDAISDADPHLVLAALDQLAGCSSPQAIALLNSALVVAQDLSPALQTSPARRNSPAPHASGRTWHRAAHAIVALAAASPMDAAQALPAVAASPVWQVRMYAANAARTLGDRTLLVKLARDEEDNVREAAIEGLSAVAGHSADDLYIEALTRGGYQVVRAAAMALAGTPSPDAAAGLVEVLRRLVEEGRDNSRDARTAISDALRGLGVTVRLKADPTNVRGVRLEPDRPMTAADLKRLTGARARITIRNVGSFELALITSEAPASAYRFATLAEAGYYSGLSFHRVVPNFVIQGGSPGANEYVGDAAFMRDEIGQWPHVRGAVGISTRGRDTGDAQIFIDLVDNPRLDHEYTVFAHVLNGMDVVDAILEGDVIDRIDIVTGT